MKGRAVAGDGWIEREEAGGAWVHARRLPCRMDLAVTAVVPARAGRRLARAIRADMWRALQGLRGFAPLVRVSPAGEGAEVTAGGQIDAPWPRAATRARLADLLADPVLQARWRGWAGLLAALLIALPAATGVVAQEAALAEPVAGVPSGLVMTLQDIIIEPNDGAAVARFRFVVPDLATVEFGQVEADFPWLCETLALPRLAQDGQAAAQVIVSLASAAIAFGETAPDVTQYFEVFRPVSEAGGDRCIWEVF